MNGFYSSNWVTIMNLKKIDFGKTRDGEKASRFILSNSKGLEVDVSDFGALLLAIRVPDKEEQHRDVLLGYDTLEEYYDNGCGFGAYVGRSANRIGNARVVLDGVTYELEANSHGNNLHSGSDRSHYKFYHAIPGITENGSYVELSRVSPHMEQGFPGNLKQKIKYMLTEENELIIDYEMVSDKTTVMNPTNHSYFNLNGHHSGDVLSHELEVYSDAFLLTDDHLLPTGEIASVDNTPMDFRKKKQVGQDIDADYEPLKLAGGYDHNYILPNDGMVKLVSKVSSPESGIAMETYTDLCGMQVYTANFLNGRNGKDGAVYGKRAGICFETQFYPNACNEKSFPSSILPAGKVFTSRTIYKFSTEKETNR